jgi:hypothetical protein
LSGGRCHRACFSQDNGQPQRRRRALISARPGAPGAAPHPNVLSHRD